MNSNNSRLVGHISMSLSILFFGLNIPALKSVMPYWFNGMDATFFRLTGATILLWIVSTMFKKEKIDKQDRLMILLSGMLGLFFFIYLFNLAVEYSSPVDISIIMTTPPILVVLISSVIFKTRITGLKLLGVLLSLLGALMIIIIGHSSPEATRSLKGNIFGILSALCYAFYIISIKKTSEKYSPITLLKWIFLGSCIGAIPLGIISKFWQSNIIMHPQLEPMLILSFVILFPTFLSYMLIPVAIKRIGHEIVSMYQYLIPVIASATAIMLKMDTLHWDQPIAAVVIVVGVYITSLANKRVNKKNINTPLNQQ